MEPDFDRWTSLFLIAAICGLFAAVLLIPKWRERKVALLSSCLLAAYSLILFQYVLYWTRYVESFPWLVFLPTTMLYFIAALSNALVKIQTGKSMSRLDYLLILPAAASFILNFPIWFGLISVSDLIQSKIAAPWIWFYAIRSPWLIAVFYGFCIFKIYSIQRDAEPEATQAFIRKAVFWPLIVFLAAYLSYYILVQFPFFNLQWDYAISVSMSLAIYVLAWKVINFKEITQVSQPARKTEVLESQTAAEIFQSIKTLIVVKGIYKKEDLRLEHLSEELGFPRHYISYAINHVTGSNFNRLINTYRVEEAARLLLSETEADIKTIWFEVGFNNKASFYQAFKERYGCTPSVFRKEQHKIATLR